MSLPLYVRSLSPSAGTPLIRIYTLWLRSFVSVRPFSEVLKYTSDDMASNALVPKVRFSSDSSNTSWSPLCITLSATTSTSLRLTTPVVSFAAAVLSEDSDAKVAFPVMTRATTAQMIGLFGFFM